MAHWRTTRTWKCAAPSYSPKLDVIARLGKLLRRRYAHNRLFNAWGICGGGSATARATFRRSGVG